MNLTPTSGPEPEDEQFDSPQGSKWIVAVDQDGFVTILQQPNLHYGFFDAGRSAEDVGLPFEVADPKPGVYEWTCSYRQTFCPETGLCDGGEFEVDSELPLWSVPA